jgi:hypothetical protein
MLTHGGYCKHDIVKHHSLTKLRLEMHRWEQTHILNVLVSPKETE